MPRQILIALSALALSSCSTAPAPHAPLETTQSAPAAASRSAELLQRMTGRWVLSGEIAGHQTTHDVEATWVLQGSYVRITEVSRERGDSGFPVYEATIFVGWLDSADRYVCLWLDNTEIASGEVRCLGAPMDDAIPFEFRDAQGALIFTNTFTYDRAADTWQWRMVNPTGGQDDVFGVVTLRRP